MRHRSDIQGLRAVAVLLVALGHAGVPFLQGGFVGVDVFFVLSGFLISSLLFKEYARHGGLDLKRFWARRAFKIWPSYFAAYGLMTACVLAGFLRAHDTAKAREALTNVIPNVLFIQNYVPEPARWLHSWSIAVEEHFYFFWPLVVWLLRGRPATLLKVALGTAVVSFAARWAASGE